MDASRWTRLNDLVADVLDAAPDARAALLATETDDALRAEATALVTAYDEADATGAIDSPFLGGDGADLPLPGPVGPWTPTARLGAGGMGVVYAAERAGEGFRQRAALKLVRPGFGADFRDRFLRERALLAGLDHPGVARLLDGGLTDDGLPYLAMELVEGEPITDYAETHGLDVRQRVALFVQACEAVAHAHRHLVVHRDLKPAHVLVASGDGAGDLGPGTREARPPSPLPTSPRVKLLDFGVAKLLSDDDGAEALTRTGGGPLTPQYAAPEQLAGGAVTTATDVYALGLLLYEMLAGRRPYDLTGKTAAETERVVQAEVPPRPSAASGDRRLAGDLDTVVLKALEKEPARRYPSADALAADLRRFLGDLPVEARPATAGYRVGRFVRRHRAAVAAGVTGALLLAAVVGAYTVRLREARDRAEAQFAVAREAARAMMYDVHDAVAGLPGATPARAVIVDRALDYLDRLATEAAADPALRVDLAGAYLRVGNVQGSPINDNLGRTADARASYESGLALLRDLPPGLPDSLATAADEAEGDLWRMLGVVVAHTVAADSSLPYFRRALVAYGRAARREPGAAEPRVRLAMGHVNLGDYAGHPSFPNTGRPDAARAQYGRARALLASIPEAERSLLALRIEGITYEREGALRRASGDLDGAADLLRQSLALRQHVAARPDATAEAARDEGIAHETLGLLAAERGRFGEAERELTTAQAVYQRLAEADPESANARQTLAFGHLHLARLYGGPDGPDGPNLGRPAAARRHAAEAARIFRALADGDPANDRLQPLAADAEALRDRID